MVAVKTDETGLLIQTPPDDSAALRDYARATRSRSAFPKGGKGPILLRTPTGHPCGGWSCTCQGLSDKFGTVAGAWHHAKKVPTAMEFWEAHRCHTVPVGTGKPPPPPESAQEMLAPTKTTVVTIASARAQTSPDSKGTAVSECGSWGCTCQGLSDKFGTRAGRWIMASGEPAAQRFWIARGCRTDPNRNQNMSCAPSLTHAPPDFHYCQRPNVVALFRASGLKAALTAAARRGKPGWIVQVGAHVGFEPNDPIASPLLAMFGEMAAMEDVTSAGIAAEWLMVEASPANYAGLVTNLELQRGKHVRFLPTNVGVLAHNVSASTGVESEEGMMTFYSMSKDIDPESGRDKRTGKVLPYWATQLGSFDKQYQQASPLASEFKLRGLVLEDYVVESDVRVLSMTRLLKEHNIPQESAALVLIDTEGFDCDIVLTLNLAKAFKPRMLVFEHKVCPSKRNSAVRHLTQAGYTTVFDEENVFAYTHGPVDTVL